MSPCRPIVLLALVGASSVAATAPAASPPLSPVSDSVNPDAATLPVEHVFTRPRPVDPAVLAQLAGRPLGLRGDCPTLVDLNGPIDGDMPREVAFLPDGSAAVIVNRDSNNVTYLDPVNLEITGETKVGEFPV